MGQGKDTRGGCTTGMQPWGAPHSGRGKHHPGHAALACSLHPQRHMVEAIRDQWVIVASIVVVAAVVVWLIARR